MSTYYVDPAASGANDGSSWTDAWVSAQSAFDTASAGDIVYCRGTQTLSAKIDIDTNAGNNTSGFIKFIGCDAGGTPKAGQFILDGNSAATNCLAFTATADYIWLENITCKNATSHGIVTINGSVSNVFIKVINENNGGCGFSSYPNECVFINCIVRGNSSHGIDRVYNGGLFSFCWIYNNGGAGVYASGHSHATFFGCCVVQNSDDQLMLGSVQYALMSVIDGENDTTSGSGINTTGDFNIMLGNRITHNDGTGKYGIEGTYPTVDIEDWNVFYDNDSNIESGVNSLGNSDTSPSDDGYVDRSSLDYNIDTGKEIRSEPIILNWA